MLLPLVSIYHLAFFSVKEHIFIVHSIFKKETFGREIDFFAFATSVIYFFLIDYIEYFFIFKCIKIL